MRAGHQALERPSRRMNAIVLALLWGAICSANAEMWLWWRGHALSAHSATIAITYFAGAFLAVPLSVLGARLIPRGAGTTAVRAYFLAALLAGTVLLTASLFALPQYFYYAQWHAPALTLMWAMQFIFTWIGAFYQFAVMALTFYFPFAFVGLFAIAWALAQWRVEGGDKP